MIVSVRTVPGSASRAATAMAAVMAIIALSGCSMPLEGVYSAEHYITEQTEDGEDGERRFVESYVYINPIGKISAYIKKTNGDKYCYALASGTDVNAPLQDHILIRGTTTTGEPDYETHLGNIRFGILDRRGEEGEIIWYLHNSSTGSTATILGKSNVVAFGGWKFSISGKRLETPTIDQIRDSQCQ